MRRTQKLRIPRYDTVDKNSKIISLGNKLTSVLDHDSDVGKRGFDADIPIYCVQDLQLCTDMATGVDSLGQFQFGDMVQIGEAKEYLKKIFLASLKSLKKSIGSGVGSGSGTGSGSISQRYGSGVPDPHRNVIDPQHCFQHLVKLCKSM